MGILPRFVRHVVAGFKNLTRFVTLDDMVHQDAFMVSGNVTGIFSPLSYGEHSPASFGTGFSPLRLRGLQALWQMLSRCVKKLHAILVLWT